MKIFKKYTLDWWQIGIFKLCLLCLGMLAGIYLFAYIAVPTVIMALWVVAIVSALYIVYAAFSQ